VIIHFGRWEMCRDRYDRCGHHEHRNAAKPMPGRGRDGNPLTVEGRRHRRVALITAWYDLWVGAYVDREGRKLYVLPLPCLGVVISW
jgi:hypothetical protein